jgi:hypothetical protein
VKPHKAKIGLSNIKSRWLVNQRVTPTAGNFKNGKAAQEDLKQSGEHSEQTQDCSELQDALG